VSCNRTFYAWTKTYGHYKNGEKKVKTQTAREKHDTLNIISTMNIKEKLSSNPLTIANAFNTYFSTVAENLLTKNFSGKNIINNKDSISYLHQNFRLYRL
jgi:hypothetical protein